MKYLATATPTAAIAFGNAASWPLAALLAVVAEIELPVVTSEAVTRISATNEVAAGVYDMLAKEHADIILFRSGHLTSATNTKHPIKSLNLTLHIHTHPIPHHTTTHPILF